MLLISSDMECSSLVSCDAPFFFGSFTAQGWADKQYKWTLACPVRASGTLYPRMEHRETALSVLPGHPHVRVSRHPTLTLIGTSGGSVSKGPPGTRGPFGLVKE